MVRQADRSATTIDAILAAARKLFRKRGYDRVTIDDIAELAGCKKGAVYHHFSSKSAIFEIVLDALQAKLAVDLAEPVEQAFAEGSPQLMADCIEVYLRGANASDVRQILLIDGPVILGWKRWREIDERHFSGMVRNGITLLMGNTAPQDLIEAATRLTLGAIMEAALACSTTPKPSAAAERYGRPFELMLQGFALGGLEDEAQREGTASRGRGRSPRGPVA